MKKKIAILGANEPLKPFFIHTRKLGYEIHCFAWEKGAVCKKFCDFFYPISFTQKDEILEICQKIKINGITSFSLESALPTVNYIARKMNLEGNNEECERRTGNKYVMRRILKEANVNVPDFLLIKNKSDLDDQSLQYPLIVKPVDNGGSRGVTLAASKKEITEAYKRAKTFSKSGYVLVEQFIDGREFSVEYISFRGKHYFVSITDKVTTGAPYFVEIEHHQPALVSDTLKNSIKKITEHMLNALMIHSGASHTEIKLNKADGELYIIEMGARMGGGTITSDLVKLSTGYDFIRGALELSTGEFSEPKFTLSKYSGVYFLSNKSPKVYHYILDAQRYSEIIRAELFKNKIVNLTENNDRTGYFIYQADKKFLIE